MAQSLWKTVWWLLKKLNIKLPYDSSNSILGTYPKELKICPHKNLYTSIHSSIIHNSQKVGTTQMSIKWQMNKQNMAYPYNRIVFGHKKQQAWCKLQRGPTLKTSRWVKEAGHKRLYILWFHLYEMSRIDKSIETERLPEDGRRGELRVTMNR